MENGPQVEVKELRPTGASPAEKRRADAIHALDTQYPIGGILWTIFLLGHPRSDNYLMHTKQRPMILN